MCQRDVPHVDPAVNRDHDLSLRSCVDTLWLTEVCECAADIAQVKVLTVYTQDRRYFGGVSHLKQSSTERALFHPQLAAMYATSRFQTPTLPGQSEDDAIDGAAGTLGFEHVANVTADGGFITWVYQLGE